MAAAWVCFVLFVLIPAVVWIFGIAVEALFPQVPLGWLRIFKEGLRLTLALSAGVWFPFLRVQYIQATEGHRRKRL